VLASATIKHSFTLDTHIEPAAVACGLQEATKDIGDALGQRALTQRLLRHLDDIKHIHRQMGTSQRCGCFQGVFR
jgi:hypothetical protein